VDGDLSELGVDVTRPNPARVYDYWLGGSNNFAVDRTLGEEMIAIDPRVRPMARDNRRFLRRAVGYLCEHGVTQFLDLGAGIPIAGSVHETAFAAHPGARVAYVDIEPVAVHYSRRELEGVAGASITHADLREVEAVLSAPGVAGLLDFTRPVAVLALLVLQYFPDEQDPAGVLERYRRSLAPGSYLAISHLTADDESVDMQGLAHATRRASSTAHNRTRGQVRALLGGCDLIAPGVVLAGDWRREPQDPPATPGVLAALARVR
jgi:SAM-dependent methyltransferase